MAQSQNRMTQWQGALGTQEIAQWLRTLVALIGNQILLLEPTW